MSVFLIIFLNCSRPSLLSLIILEAIEIYLITMQTGMQKKRYMSKTSPSTAITAVLSFTTSRSQIRKSRKQRNQRDGAKYIFVNVVQKWMKKYQQLQFSNNIAFIHACFGWQVGIMHIRFVQTSFILKLLPGNVIVALRSSEIRRATCLFSAIALTTVTLLLADVGQWPPAVAFVYRVVSRCCWATRECFCRAQPSASASTPRETCTWSASGCWGGPRWKAPS